MNFQLLSLVTLSKLLLTANAFVAPHLPCRPSSLALSLPRRVHRTASHHHNAIPTNGNNNDVDNDNKNNDVTEIINSNKVTTRRSALQSAAACTTTSLGLLISQKKPSFAAADDDDRPPTKKTTPIKACWKAVDGLMSSDKKDFVAFDISAYKAMVNDQSRTPLFEKAIKDRLNAAPGGPSSQTVLDLGTGPFAFFAISAANAGAGKVYAIEANPEAAANARLAVKKFGFDDVVTILEGFSSDITLPDNDKADFAVAEIVGSIATEEGAYATVSDAHKRLIKVPNDPNNWIPSRIQTYAAPASYTLHNLFQPPAFDWGKLNGDPVRFNCRDDGLQLLSDPVLVEDISFADINSRGSSKINKEGDRKVTFTVDGGRITRNTKEFYDELRRGKLEKTEALEVAKSTASSLTGIAMWPRLLLDNDGVIEINSRSYPDGGHQKSHWQTVLPIMSDVPVPVAAGDEVAVTFSFDVGGDLLKPPSYRIEGDVKSNST